jgi:hypothetical protein
LKTNISVWFDKYFVQPWRLYVHSKRARSWRCKIEARWPVADYKIHTQARLLVGIRPSSASLVRRCTCVYLQQIDGISCVCGYWKGTYAVLNTYGITIEFIDALAVSKSATGETVKIVDVEVYDDKERHVNSSLLSSVPYPTFRKDFDGTSCGTFSRYESNGHNRSAYRCESTITTQRHHFAFCGQQSNEAQKRWSWRASMTILFDFRG